MMGGRPIDTIDAAGDLIGMLLRLLSKPKGLESVIAELSKAQEAAAADLAGRESAVAKAEHSIGERAAELGAQVADLAARESGLAGEAVRLNTWTDELNNRAARLDKLEAELSERTANLDSQIQAFGVEQALFNQQHQDRVRQLSSENQARQENFRADVAKADAEHKAQVDRAVETERAQAKAMLDINDRTAALEERQRDLEVKEAEVEALKAEFQQKLASMRALAA